MTSQYEDLNHILVDGEEVLLELKPNRSRFIYIGQILPSLLGILFGAIFFTVGLLGVLGILSPEDPDARFGFIVFLVFGAVPLLTPIINFFTRFTRYKNVCYVVTNQRLIIRSGFIGIDYKELNIKAITTTDVRVDFFDKLVHPNTGTIFFGSASNPVVVNSNNSNARQFSYKFEYIENPYDNYKRIKDIIAQNQ